MSLGVEVILNNLNDNPVCKHGPTVLFERFLANGEKESFYACSACRSRKLCSFYAKAETKQKHPFLHQEKGLNILEHKKLYNELMSAVDRPSKGRIYCCPCSMYIEPKDKSEHTSCFSLSSISKEQLKYPSKILPAKEVSKFESQYYFSSKSLSVLMSLIQEQNYKKVLCIGCPRIHEDILNKDCFNRSSYLLDIDRRFRSFFPPDSYQVYNLFNHYFFAGKEGMTHYETFMKGDDVPLLILDPPFGGRMELVARTINEIEKDWRRINEFSEKDSLPVMLLFPYFLEAAVMKNLPKFSMLDYKVNYENHPVYTTGPKGMRNGSAVRIFVNIDAAKCVLPIDEGYTFCSLCQRYVHSNNVHCRKCRGCMSKDGNTYKHCNICARCVKPSWRHCDTCSRCQPQLHNCEEYVARLNSATCHICGESGHKRRNCNKRSLIQSEGSDEPSANQKRKKRRKREKV